jgi:hypothetical protein
MLLQKNKKEKMCYVISTFPQGPDPFVSTTTLQANTYVHTLGFIITDDIYTKRVLAQFEA